MGNLGFSELAVIAIVGLLVLGPRRLPAVGRALGEAARAFKMRSKGSRRPAMTPLAVATRRKTSLSLRPRGPFRWAAAAAAATVLLAALVVGGQLAGADRIVADWVDAWRAPIWDRLMRGLTQLGGSQWMLAAMAVAGAVVWRRAGAAAALTAAGAYGLGTILVIGLKLLVGHWRPDATVIPEMMDLQTRLHLAGFPSGHAFRSAFVLGWLGAGWRSTGGLAMRLLCVLVIGAVGLSRIYLQRHWATDVLGGWLLALTMLGFALNAPSRRDR